MSIAGRKFIKEFVEDLDNAKNPFIDEAEDVIVDETKPNRLKHHIFNTNTSFAQISGERNKGIYEPVEGDTPKIDLYKRKKKQEQSASNNKRTAQLIKDIKDMGLSFIKTYGAWKENDKTTREKSFIIPNITKEQAMELGKKYNQYSIIYREKGDNEGNMFVTLPDNFGDVDMTFNLKGDVDNIDGSKELDNFNGYSGLKRNGKGYNFKYKEKKKEPN